jgi:hypothetical protein
MSTINTNGLNVNYPIPGENNSTQGFRDNFASIKTNLDTAGTEITDLQNKVVLKAALNGSVLNNDMANTLISNASTRSFRATTYNLGNALSGTVLVNVSQADVQYGNVAGNVTLQFGSWAPTNTESAITLRLGFPPSPGNITSNAIVTFPSQVVALNNNFGGTIVENSANIANITITAPHDVQQLEFKLRTLDCGNTITIEPINRPYQSTQIIKRTPPSTGQQGDKVGTICVDAGTSQLVVSSVTTTNITLSGVQITGTAGQFSCSASASPLIIGQPLTISGTLGGTGSITSYSNPTTYYIIATNGSTTFTLSATLNGSAIVTTAGTPTGLTYTVKTSALVMASTANLYSGLSVVFTGVSLEPNITVGNTYYVKNVFSSTNFTVSSTVDGSIISVAANASGTTMFLNPAQYMYIAVNDYSANFYNRNITSTTLPNIITVSGSTANLAVNNPIIFAGNALGNTANIELNTVYYINSVSGSNVTISKTRYNGVAGPEYTNITTVGSGNVDIDYTVYEGPDIFRRTTLNPF